MEGPTDELPISFERGDPVVEHFLHAGRELRVTRTHCVDKMGPNAKGFYEFHYEYDVYDFTHATETLSARSYTWNHEEASFLRIEVDGKQRFLAKVDFRRPVARAALEYLRRAGKSKFIWLDRRNRVRGYSPVPPEEAVFQRILAFAGRIRGRVADRKTMP